MAEDPVDVVVVGSGAGGAPVAYALAQAGIRVVVLDKGRRYCNEDFDHDEVRMCRRTFFVPPVAEDPHTLRVGETAVATRTTAGWVSTVVGGGTVHMAGYFHRLHPVDFQLRSTLGHIEDSTLEDWPIHYEDLEPFYAAVERELGVSGIWHAHPFEEPRSADYPCPPLAEHSVAREIDKACARLKIHPFPTPRAIVSREYGGRMACMYCALCASYGCEIGAKSSTLVTFLPAAEASGHCEVRPECMVIEIPVDAGGRVTGVVYRTPKGDSIMQRARCVVVAATAIESARLLLLSRSARFPSGLANSNGLVGKNLVFSGEAKGEALFKRQGREAVPWLRDPSPFVQRSVQDFYFLDRPVEGIRKAGTIIFAMAHPNPILTAERIAGSGPNARWGIQLKEALREEAAGARTLTFETFGEFLPTRGTYIDLDPSRSDHSRTPQAGSGDQPIPGGAWQAGTRCARSRLFAHHARRRSGYGSPGWNLSLRAGPGEQRARRELPGSLGTQPICVRQLLHADVGRSAGHAHDHGQCPSRGHASGRPISGEPTVSSQRGR